MIVSFGNEDTELVFRGERPRRLPTEILAVGKRKLQIIHEATLITDLRNPPGNSLELLQGDRAGQHSIRINRQWRVCFRWVEIIEDPLSNRPQPGNAHDVEIVDYH